MTTTTTPKTPAIDAEILIGTLADSSTGLMLPDGLRLTFGNGAMLTLRVTELPATIIAQAIIHGLKQKLVDAAAISRDPATGRAASIDTKFAAVKDVYDRLLSGAWNKPRGEGAPTGGLLLAALVRMYDGKKTPEQLRAYLDGKTPAEQAALRKNPKVAAIITDIQAERAAANPDAPDSDELLGELDA